MEIQKVIDRMRTHPGITIHRGATKEDIRAVLRIMKVKLPATYVEFLLQCGWADISGDVVYGLGPDATRSESVFEVWGFEGLEVQPPMPARLVPLMADGAGNHECLDTSKIKDGDCPVVFWDHEHARGELQVPKLISKSFSAWLDRKVREAPDV